MPTPVVLLADEDLDNLLGRATLLEREGCDVLISTSPREALRLFSSCRVDAVILNDPMQGMRGDAVAVRMKRLKSDIPIMLLSANDTSAEELLDYRVDMFFSKGEPPWTFVAAVHDLLSAREHFFSKWLRDWRQRTEAA